MPPRTTQKSHRPRVSDRTMVGNCHPLLAGAEEAAGRTRKNMTPRTSHGSEKENHARAKYIAAANRGWMSEKVLPPADQVKCFYLTSPFIEPAACRRKRSRWKNAKEDDAENLPRKRERTPRPGEVYCGCQQGLDV